jgi:formiminotetrahydrofolate cyclodeaminase
VTLANLSTRMLVSDVGIAVTLAWSTIQSAVLSVEINLETLEDAQFVHDVRNQLRDLTVGLAEETQGVQEIVLSRIRA